MFRFLTLVLLCCTFVGCAEQTANQAPTETEPPAFNPTVRKLDNGEMSHITVQHVLIAFDGTIEDKVIGRTQAEAEKLAKEVFEKAKSGEDFGKLVEEFTDDAAPGIYKMANFDEASYMAFKPEDRVYPRGDMVPVFGDVGFPLEVGEIGLGEYDPKKSKYGWHIVKRLK